jgi:hypothetical protein
MRARYIHQRLLIRPDLGVFGESYVEGLIDQQVSQPHKTSCISSEELDQVLDSLAEGSDERPVLQPEVYTRESIYQDYN